ncbi:MAG: hypothetical protein KKC24_23725 [Gammaproteobacteria bacterium]|nr:hypothetical protein [Gammaproteobacteria bacterium]MBU0821858.1 hypothetical protein [Gammaproteobacteria bacterium]MBU0843971.1 hypothetical protein [Gammaproteobacteria bacterium]MBU1842222.1 hypothetical protein [Gammaproteobacteria bacterium]
MNVDFDGYRPSRSLAFPQGSVVKVEGNILNTAFLVVGENGTHMHTFIMNGSNKGCYYGFFKAPENFRLLRRIQ